MRQADSIARRLRSVHVGLLLALVLAMPGCGSSRWISVRSVPKNPLMERLKLGSWGGLEPTERTMLILRRYDLQKDFKDRPLEVLQHLEEIAQARPDPETYYAAAEIAYIAAADAKLKDRDAALDYCGTCVTHAFTYLFDPRFNYDRNPYDPQFRGACELYNGALEQMLRILRKEGALVVGRTHTVHTKNQTCDVVVVARSGNWHPEDFDRFEFCSDFEIDGIANYYRTYGLGVPLIAVRKAHPGQDPSEQYYPPGMSSPVTAFVRPMDSPASASAADKGHCVLLELYDPLSSTEIIAGQLRVPLESDLTTPLAYFLHASAIDRFATLGLLHPDETQKDAGLFMTQPYDPHKIPVLFVHGLWSDPSTWAEMFNDLRGLPEIRDHYQFWYYLYPTGQPFWISAARLRADLAAVRDAVDPDRRSYALDQMVLVGHSMGGLVSKLQAIDSGNELWNSVSSKPFYEIKASEPVKMALANVFFFQQGRGVRRVVTIGTPHRGSRFSNLATQWLGAKLISMPKQVIESYGEIYRNNPGVFLRNSPMRVRTSIDSLSPDSPLLPVLARAPLPPGVRLHNIVGKEEPDADGDGVVSLASARLENAASELIVEADHMTVHRHPLTVLEVRRILLEHLDEVRRTSPWYLRPRQDRVLATSGPAPWPPIPPAP
jgi:pimeloyl-ACP methyl ester carboxylesterase